MIMATISENLQIIKNSTDAIKQAIIDKGGTIEGDITTWADAISGISGGGSSLLFDKYTYSPDLIQNKLNGSTIGEVGVAYGLETLLHKYTFSTLAYDIILIAESENYPGSNLDMLYNLIEQTNDYGFKNCVCRNLVGDNKDYLYIQGYDSKRPDYLNISFSHCDPNGGLRPANPVSFYLLCFGDNNTYDLDTFTITVSESYCYLKDTAISLSNGNIKKVQDITYNDELLVWNFDEAKFDKAKPLWIKKKEITSSYYKVNLENGTTLNLVGSNGKCHRLFNYDDQLFESATGLVGKQVSTLQGLSKVISCEKIEETCEYYNIITEYHMNCYANGVLTSCRYNNLYPIVDMKFDKAQVKLEPRYKIHAEKFKPNPEILPKYIRGMRLDENTTISIEDMKKYISNLERVRKNIDDFEENQEMVESVEEASVGWIDRNGKSYGFKLYMPGQNNHIILADKICKELNIETDNPSRYLETEGWVKYTTDFVLNSDDKEINDRQLNTLRKFVKVPNKLKTDGKIRIGDFMSPHVDISEFDNMDKYSFEYRKKHNRRR
jgi:hypothetical protein